MTTVALKALSLAPSPDGYVYYDMVTFKPGSPPDRPTPGPQPPDTRPPGQIALPIAPGGPDPGWPDKPGYPDYITGWPVPPGGYPEAPKPPQPTPGPGASAIVIPLPETDPPTPPPAGMAAGSKQMLIWFGPGTKPALAWVNPYPSTGPVAPPAEGAAPPA